MTNEEIITELNSIASSINGLLLRLARDDKTVTLETVRAVLVEKSKSGHSAEVRELLYKYGAIKLSKVDPEDYAALLADAERITDAE